VPSDHPLRTIRTLAGQVYQNLPVYGQPVSYLTDPSVDGYPGQAAWEWFKSKQPCQGYFGWNPKWSIGPLQ